MTISKEEFQKTKKIVQKKYPNAKTVMDSYGKYYVATEDGRDICNIQISQTINSYDFGDETDLYGFNATLNKVCTIPHSKTITEAWKQAQVAIKSYHVVERNSNKFNDEKVMKKMAKDFE
jgi:hypothetical protein